MHHIEIIQYVFTFYQTCSTRIEKQKRQNVISEEHINVRGKERGGGEHNEKSKVGDREVKTYHVLTTRHKGLLL